MSFVLALTAGLLLYLFIDTLMEGFEAGGEALGRLRGQIAVIVAALLTAMALFAVGRSGGRAPEGVQLAAFIALGIGIHNFGEGLAVGAALATGAAALATFLVVGFAIHNVSEGFGIAVPLIGQRAPHRHLRGLGAARRASGRPRRLARLAGGRPVLDRALLRHRRRRDPAGDRRGAGAACATERSRRADERREPGGRRARARRDVRDGDSGVSVRRSATP